MSGDVVITGLGTICAQGMTVPLYRASLIAGHSAIGPLGRVAEGTKISVGALVSDLDNRDNSCFDDLTVFDRSTQFAVIASREAVSDAGLYGAEHILAKAAAIIGTGCGGKQTDEETYAALYRDGRTRTHPLTIPKGMPSAAASAVSSDLGIKGPVFSVASACASGAHAIIQGYLMIRAGLVDVALVGGTDAPFTYGLLKAWESLRVVSNDTCRPFSKSRSGMVLGEGAGILVLERKSRAIKRRAKIYAELAGCGMSSDAGHVTRPDIHGIARAIMLALKDAGVSPEAVDYVNAHGTGTVLNDLVETQALKKVFGTHAERLAISSTKSMHGHALGAASALEVIATVIALNCDLIPPTANFTEPGEGCDLDYVPNTAREMKIQFALSNSFAFGGLNAVLALKRMN